MLKAVRWDKFEDVQDIYSLYILSQVIPTSSTDVERGFSELSLMLGKLRMRTLLPTLDARLRVKLSLPNQVQRDELEWVGEEPQPEDTAPSSYELYERMLKQGDKVDMMSRCMHAAADISTDTMWGMLAQEFADVGEPDVEDEAEGVPEDDTFDISVEALAEQVQQSGQPAQRTGAARAAPVAGSAAAGAPPIAASDLVTRSADAD